MPAPAITEALVRLTRLGYIDDAAFARQFARARLLAGGQSRYRIRSELLRRGVDRGLAESAIEDTLADESVDEAAILERVAEKKARSLAKVDPLTRRRRLYGFLARRGFESDEIRGAVERIERAEREGETGKGKGEM
jgi:regulatory protein